MTQATNTSLGEIKLAGDLAGNNNANAPELTPTAVTPGVYPVPVLTLNAKGLVTDAYSASSATITALFPDATASSKGVVQVGTNINVSSGVISVADATTSTKGVASFSTEFTLSSGAASLNYAGMQAATGSVFGVVKSGTNITNTAGVLSVADATNSVKGVLTTADSSVLSFSAGVLSLGVAIARTDVQNTWTKAQSYSISTLTYGATVTPDFSLSNVFTLTATGNFTLANPTNAVAGTTYLIFIKQDATGGRTITWGSNFKFGLNSVNTISTGANKTDIISIVAQSSTELLVTIQAGY